MKNPTPPRKKFPRMTFTRSPSTCVPMINTASLHPQRRRLNQPVPALAKAALRMRKRPPIPLPSGAICR
jgi:hypothetical protein